MKARQKLRFALLVSFGGLLAMLLVGGMAAIATVQRLHAEEEAARTDFLSRNHCLMSLHVTLDVYSRRIDEYFLENDVQTSAASDFAQLTRQVAEALASYPYPRGAEEDQLLAAVKKALVEDQASLNEALSEDQRDDPEKTSRLLYGRVMPRNRQLIEATEQVEMWNHRRLDLAGTAMLESFGALQARLLRLLLIVVVSGLLLAIGSIVYIIHQDQEVRRLPSRLLDAQEEERRSISRELHDEVGQALGALLVDVGRLKTAIPSDDAVAQEQLGKIKAAAESAVNSVRNIALLLRPAMLDDLGLIAAIEWQGREVSRRSEMEVEVDSSGASDDLKEDCKICIYRITQEALNNAVRHSGARHAWVTLSRTSGAIVVSIRDDGRGFDSAKTRGLGILGMEERVRRLGGKLEIVSKPGSGTTVKAELPHS